MKKIYIYLLLSVVLIFFTYKVCYIKHQNKIFQSSFIVNTQGGIGNQMFKYAFGLNYSKKFNKKMCIPQDNKISSVFNISAPICEESGLGKYVKLLEELESAHKTVVLNSFDEQGPQNSPKYIAFSGYQQDPRFFREIQDMLPQEFSFKEPLAGQALKLSLQMKKTNSVCLHFRRGDYVGIGYPILTNQYYFDAIEYIKKKTKLPVYLYTFSNDIEWVKKNFRPKEPITYVEGFDDKTDLHLMTQCKHNVIANSSFSWWGAFLNSNPDKIVVAPDVWDKFELDWGKNIIPSTWKVLHTDYTKGRKMAIIYSATDINFFESFYSAMEKYFFPNIQKIYYVFTDDTTAPLPKNAVRIYQEKLPYPYSMLKSFHLINSQIHILSKYEYIFFTNAQMVPIRPIGKEILPTAEDKFVFAQHFYQSKEPVNRMSYDRNVNSRAYIPYGEGQYYVWGNFFGGKSLDFLNLSQFLQKNIDGDLENKVVAQCYIESYVNRFLVNLLKQGHSPILLSPAVVMPEKEYNKLLNQSHNINLAEDTRIILLDKENISASASIKDNFFKKIYYNIKFLFEKSI